MSKKVEVEEIVSKIQDLSWGSLETAEEQSQDPVCYFEGLGDEAAEIHQWIRGEMEHRGLTPIANRFRIPEPKPEIREESEMDSITIDWREDTMRYYRDLICRGLGITPEELERDERLTAYYQGVAGTAIAERMQPSAVECGIIAGRVTPTEHMLEIARDAEIVNAALDPERLGAECMDAYRAGLNQNTTLNDFRGLRAAIRDLVDSVMASFDIFFKACSLLIDVRVLCVWDEFVWNTKNKIKRQPGMKAWEIHLTDHFIRDEYQQYFQRYYSMTEVEFNDLRARGQATVRDRQERLINSQLTQEWPPGGLNLGSITEEELNRFRAQMLAFCTPSRFGLTGRQ